MTSAAPSPRYVSGFASSDRPCVMVVERWSQPMETDDERAYESIMQELNEALDHAKDKETGARVHKVEVPAVNVAAIRASTGLSQGAFARSIVVAKGTLLNWEHGRRRPTGPAQVLLAMIARKPPS